MAKQDDRNRASAIDLVEALHDRIIELENELSELQDKYEALESKLEYSGFRCESLEDELTDIKFPE